MGEHGKYWPLVRVYAAVLMFWASAATADCRLALVLALDVSSSVDATEDALQRQGLAAALIAPEVEAAFFAAPQPVALSVFEWSGRWNQKILLDWVLIDSRGALVRAAERLARSTRSTQEFPTALGHALGFAATRLGAAPPCLFRTVDISGDGKNNEGFGAAEAYAAFPFQDVTVNGLAINAADFEGELDLLDYYRTQVLHGPGAFLEIANGFDDFERAMRRKLERELRPPTLGLLEVRP
ncbi:DUF1194 domain-containing protein [Shimia biformata]|uniref:DUF1194 domain-containing protein n=1 Tax=Shimia biformata TaxID=1294299 RepID=UPI001951EB9F|nr:DUF1194 domain-containing protein [Shimia biformata]